MTKPYELHSALETLREALADAGALDDPDEEGYSVCQAFEQIREFITKSTKETK